MADPLSIEARRYRLPLRRPLDLARGIRLTAREGVLLRVRFADGAIGYGDAAPLPGWSIETTDDVLRALAGEAPWPPSLAFALSAARHAWAQRERRVVPVCSLVGRDRAAIPDGALVAKVKVAGDRRAEAERLHRLAAAQPATSLRVDANRCWNFDDAVAFGCAIRSLRIAFVEEPTFETRRLPDWKAATGLPLALDESVVAGERLDAADVLVLKPTLLGSWERCLELAALAKPVVVSACYESGVGVHALACLAADLAAEPLAAGLDTCSALAADLIEEPLGIPIQAGGTPPRVLWDELAV